MKFATFPRILRRRLQTSTSQSTKSLPLPRETHHFGASSNPPRLPTFLQPSRNLTNSCACHVFGNVSKSLRLPREKPLKFSTSKNVPRPSGFNDFDFQIVLARRCGANFGKLNFQKCSEHAAWCLFFVKIALARRRGANFPKLNFQKCSEPTVF